MSLWKANELQTKADVMQRGLFRLVWCSIGCLIGWGVAVVLGLPVILNNLLLLSAGILLVGIITDTIRLSCRRSPNSK